MITPFVLAFFLGPLVVMALQAILNRLWPRKGPQALTMLSMVLGYFAFFAWIAFLPFETEKNLAFFTYLFLLYSFSAYTYFHAFNMSETSRRVRLIQAVARKGRMQPADLETIFADGPLFTTRLERLEALGQIRCENGRYYGKGKLFYRVALMFYGLGCLLDRPWLPMRRFRQRLAR